MCGKYALMVGNGNDKVKKIVETCNIPELNDWDAEHGKAIDISPNDTVPALMVVNRRVTACSMQWGFEKESGSMIINARSEDLHQRPMFRSLADHQRCVLPAAGYYEWRDSDHLRYLVTQQGQQPFYLAGLYRSDAQGKLHFVVLTRAAFGEHAKVHDRMPCLLFSKEEVRQWLDGTMPPEAFSRQDISRLYIEAQEPEQIRMNLFD